MKESGYIFMKGNLSEGYIAFGPFEDIEDAFTEYDFEEGWIMTLHLPDNKESRGKE